MELIDILSSRAVLPSLNVTSKKRLLQEIAQTAETVYGLPSKEVFTAMQDRELLGPTGMGNGVAIPHARIVGTDVVRGIFVKLDKPVDYESVDHQPVDIVFALFAPKSAGAEHLKALARVSRTLRNLDVCGKLRSSGDAAVLYAILTSDQASKAA